MTNNELDLNTKPDPEGMEQLEGMEFTEEVVDMTETTQEMPEFNPQERVAEYFNKRKMNREQHRKIKSLSAEKFQEWLDNYTANKTREGLSLYTQIMLGNYLEVLTSVLKEDFSFTDEQIEDLNKAIEKRGSKEESLNGIDENGEIVEIEEVK